MGKKHSNSATALSKTTPKVTPEMLKRRAAKVARSEQGEASTEAHLDSLVPRKLLPVWKEALEEAAAH